jgi:hypothetical protein
MTKQMKAAMAAMLMIGTLPVVAQTSQTDVVKVAPGQQKKTVIHRKNGSTDTVVSEGVGGQTAHHTARRRPVHAIARKEPVESETSRELRELREKQAAQQAEIDALTQANAAKDAALASANASAAQAQQTAQTATAQAQSVSATVQQNTDAVQALKSNVTDLQTTNAGLASTISANKVELTDQIESPTTIHYKGVTITPVAFFAGEGVWRQHSVNSDINTPFNSIPFPSANEGHVSELNFTSRQSRLGGLFEANAGTYKLSGYFEADFLGTGTSSNNNQSNSYVFRQRQIWGKAETAGGFAVVGGQQWSLITENRRGTDNRTETLPNTIDSQYLVGYSWERQPGFRLQQRFGDYKTGAVTVAVAAEQAQITNFTANGTNPTQYFFGGLGQNGGLYNAAASSAGATTTTTTCTTPSGTTTCVTAITATTSNVTTYANNVAPDVLVKFAFDKPLFHAEVGGIARFFRNEYLPVATYGGTAAAPTYTYGTSYLNHTSTGGGVFGSLRGYVGKKAEIAVQGAAGPGLGRYGSAQLADVTLRPDETLEPIRNYHGLGSLELHVLPKLDLFGYYGGEYDQRTVYTDPAGNLTGYGPRNLSDSGCYNLPAAPSSTIGNAGSTGSLSATSCGSPTRYIQEAMGGFIYRVVNSPKYGRLQYWATYSYLQRNLWSGVGSATTPSGPRATEPMIHVSMRYYIP